MLKTQPLEEKPPQVLGEEEIFSLQDRKNTLKPYTHRASVQEQPGCGCRSLISLQLRHWNSRGEGCFFLTQPWNFRTRATAMAQEVGRCGGKGMNDNNPIVLGLIRSRYVITRGLN